MVLASTICLAGSSKEAGEVRSHTNFYGVVRERVVLTEIQRGVQNMSL